MKMNTTMKTVVGGLAAALASIVFIISGAAGYGQYFSAVISGILLLVISYKTGVKTALCSFAAINVICFIFCADRSGIMLFAALTGYYPVIRGVISRLKNTLLRIVIKIILSAVTGSAYFYTGMTFFGFNFVISGLSGELLFTLLVAAYIILFFIYDTILHFFDKKYKNRIIKLMGHIIK